MVSGRDEVFVGSGKLYDANEACSICWGGVLGWCAGMSAALDGGMRWGQGCVATAHPTRGINPNPNPNPNPDPNTNPNTNTNTNPNPDPAHSTRGIPPSKLFPP